METPKTKSGRVTERIMTIFWAGKDHISLPTPLYNRIWSHVLGILEEEYPSSKLDIRKMVRPGDEPLA